MAALLDPIVTLNDPSFLDVSRMAEVVALSAGFVRIAVIEILMG